MSEIAQDDPDSVRGRGVLGMGEAQELVVHLDPAEVEALRSREVGDLETLRRFSVAELTAWDGIGAAGCDALRAFMVARGMPWGVPQVADRC